MADRYCTTSKNGNMHKARIATMICPRSTICLFGMADREFNEIYSHFGSTKPPKIWPKAFKPNAAKTNSFVFIAEA